MFEQSPTIEKLAKALSLAQSKFASLGKNKTVKIQTRNSGAFSFNYADLATIWENIRPVLGECGLSVTQYPLLTNDEVGYVGIVTQVQHASGEWQRCTLHSKPTDHSPREIGIVITYLRRYSLSAALGIVSDEDTDGQGEQSVGDRKTGNKTPQPQGKPASQPNAAPPAKSNVVPLPALATAPAIDGETWERLNAKLKTMGIANPGQEKGLIMKTLGLKAGKLLAELTQDEALQLADKLKGEASNG